MRFSTAYDKAKRSQTALLTERNLMKYFCTHEGGPEYDQSRPPSKEVGDLLRFKEIKEVILCWDDGTKTTWRVEKEDLSTDG